VLIIGDFHIPYRAEDIPEEFKKMLVPNKIKHVLCTGNLCSPQVLDYLKSISPNVHVVRGDFDDIQDFPDTKIVEIGQLKFGLTHGHEVIPWGDPESLANLQRRLDVDVLVTGHTHKNEVYQYENRYIVNPGSVTGAYSSFTSNVVPSFILISMKGSRIVTTYVYELRDNNVVVSKS